MVVKLVFKRKKENMQIWSRYSLFKNTAYRLPASSSAALSIEHIRACRKCQGELSHVEGKCRALGHNCAFTNCDVIQWDSQMTGCWHLLTFNLCILLTWPLSSMSKGFYHTHLYTHTHTHTHTHTNTDKKTHAVSYRQTKDRQTNRQTDR